MQQVEPLQRDRDDARIEQGAERLLGPRDEQQVVVPHAGPGPAQVFHRLRAHQLRAPFVGEARVDPGGHVALHAEIDEGLRRDRAAPGQDAGLVPSSAYDGQQQACVIVFAHRLPGRSGGGEAQVKIAAARRRCQRSVDPVLSAG